MGVAGKDLPTVFLLEVSSAPRISFPWSFMILALNVNIHDVHHKLEAWSWHQVVEWKTIGHVKIPGKIVQHVIDRSEKPHCSGINER